MVAETATFTQTHFKGFEMWIWRRIEKIGWLDKVTDEEVFRRVNEDRQVLNSIWQRKHRLFETWQTFCMLIIKGRMRGKPTRGRRRIQCYTIWQITMAMLHSYGQWGQKRMVSQREDVKNLLYQRRLLMICLFVLVRLSVPVQVIDWKDSPPK